jgi:phosphoribosyl 1,2-cyclic phosphate phosphodiesterase
LFSLNTSLPDSTDKAQVIVLGSGTSQGVPMIGCDCEVCLSADARDQRTRSSLYVAAPEIAFLVDTTPDLRAQALRERLGRVNAVVYTHAHADHIMGFDDLRRFCDLNGGVMPVYGSADTLAVLQRIFFYAFDQDTRVPGYVHAIPHPVDSSFELGKWRLTPLPVPHGRTTTYGYLFERNGRKQLAYLSDCKSVPPEAREKIRDVPLLIIDGLRDEEHPTHLTVGEAVEVGKDVRAKQTYLTHLTHQKSHAVRSEELPDGVQVAYDGLLFQL